MARAVIITNERQTHHVFWGGSFAQGLRRHGWAVDVRNDYAGADLVVMWGVRRHDLIERARADGAEICILERGYVGDRFAWSSVSFGGGLNGRGVFRGPFDDATRWQKNFADLLKPWRESERGDVVIMEQIPNDQAVAGVNLRGFYRRATLAFQEQGFTVRRRPHPNMSPLNSMLAIEAARESLQADMAAAAIVVTYNSNSAVDAVLAGVPAVAADVGSMAWAVTGHDMTPPPKPDRAAWAAALAWKQYTVEEMESGFCWDCVRGAWREMWQVPLHETNPEFEAQ